MATIELSVNGVNQMPFMLGVMAKHVSDLINKQKDTFYEEYT